MRNFLFTCLLAISVLGYSQEEKKDSIPSKWNVTGQFTFLFNQSSFSNWKAGGDNTVAGNVAINYDFNFKNKGWNWDNRIRTVFDLSNVKGAGFRKNSDRFEYNSLLGKKTKKNWFLSFFLNFKTQYTKGFDYKKTPKIAISDFFAPAYLSFGSGLLWKNLIKRPLILRPLQLNSLLLPTSFLENTV